MARPSKLNQTLLNTFKEVVESNILYCTDEDLFLLLNKRLDKKDQICYSTFQKWKAGSQEKNELFEEFLLVIKGALIKQKQTLLSSLKTTDQAWQRFAWIIERKFDEWNITIKNKVESNSTVNLHFDKEDEGL